MGANAWTVTNLADAVGAPLGVHQPAAWADAAGARYIVFQGYSPVTGGTGHLHLLHAQAPGGTERGGGSAAAADAAADAADWALADLTELTGAPEAATTARGYSRTADGSQHVVYQGRRFDGHVHELSCFDAADDWAHRDLTETTGAPLALSQPSGFETRYDATQRVVYQGRDGHIHQLAEAGGAWRHEDLTALSGAPACAPDAAPAGYGYDARRSAHVVVRTADGHLLEYREQGGEWEWNDLTLATRSPVASDAETVCGYVLAAEPTQHVDFVGGDGHVHELWRGDGEWRHGDLTAAAGAPAAQATTQPASYAAEDGPGRPTQHVLFVGTDAYVHELWWAPSAWHYTEVTSAALGSLRVLGHPVGFAVADGTHDGCYLADSHELVLLRARA